MFRITYRLQKLVSGHLIDSGISDIWAPVTRQTPIGLKGLVPILLGFEFGAESGGRDQVLQLMLVDVVDEISQGYRLSCNLLCDTGFYSELERVARQIICI